MSTHNPASHLIHDELSPVGVLAADCRQIHSNPLLAGHHLAGIAHRVGAPAPSIHFEDQPREVAKRDIPISDAAARLAGALHLHLD